MEANGRRRRAFETLACSAHAGGLEQGKRCNESTGSASLLIVYDYQYIIRKSVLLNSGVVGEDVAWVCSRAVCARQCGSSFN